LALVGRADARGGSPSDKQEGEWATVRLLLPRSGYAPRQKSGPWEVGITAEGDNDALGGLFLAGWSVLHALPRTPPTPRSQVGRLTSYHSGGPVTATDRLGQFATFGSLR
jgi:hypothetical protein